jgi:tetratricopeptide (TPR) repeat protein
MESLAEILIAETRYPEAENLNRETLEINRRVYGRENTESLECAIGLAETLIDEGRYAEAESVIHETLDIGRRVLGPQNPLMLTALEDEALDLSHRGRYDDAKDLYREAMKTADRKGEPSIIAHAWYKFACGAAIAGRHDEALQYLDKAIALGHWAPVVIATDPDLKSLHGNGHFEALIAKAHQRSGM